MAHRSRRGDRRLIQLGRALVARLSRAARCDLTVRATGFGPAAVHQQWESGHRRPARCDGPGPAARERGGGDGMSTLPLHRRAWLYLRAANLIWNIAATQDHLAEMTRDGIADSETQRAWRDHMAAERVEQDVPTLFGQ